MEIIQSVYKTSQIERKKQQLNKLVKEKGSMTDPDVISVSQELDQMIIKAQLKLKRSVSA